MEPVIKQARTSKALTCRKTPGNPDYYMGAVLVSEYYREEQK
jgi:hypothetical protein